MTVMLQWEERWWGVWLYQWGVIGANEYKLRHGRWPTGRVKYAPA